MVYYAHIYIYIHALNTSNAVILRMIKIATKIPLKIPVSRFQQLNFAKGCGDLIREFLFRRQLKTDLQHLQICHKYRGQSIFDFGPGRGVT